jgi:SAM-dependent methyltransferase
MAERRHRDSPPPRTFDWTPYYRAVARNPARDTAIFALDKFDEVPKPGRFAVDLGCGNGTDVRQFLKRGWRVLGIDKNLAPLRELVKRTAKRRRGRLTVRQGLLESTDIPQADLVNASFALPFCSPRAFPKLWERIRRALPPGSRFAGTFFGPRDDWAVARHMTFHRRSDLRKLFAGFQIEFLRETDSDSKTALGVPKHWHRFEVVARRL